MKSTPRKKANGPVAEASTSSESTYSSSLPPTLQVPDELAGLEQPLPYREVHARRPINAKLWAKVGAALASLLLAFLLVYVAIARTRSHFAARNPPRTPPAVVPTAPAAPTAPSNSIFDENYVAPPDQQPRQPTQVANADTVAPPPEQPAVPVIQVTPAIVPKRVEGDASQITDQAIHDAISKGVAYLIKQVEGEQFEPADGDRPIEMEGRFALIVLALLHAGQATDDPRLNMNGELMPALIDRMKRMPMTEGRTVYARAVRAMALAVHARRQDRAQLQGDLEFLLKASMGGAYFYHMPASKEERERRHYDNSNTQYGVLGVWAAADAGLSVPPTYWEDVEKHWTECQLESGAWSYNPTAGARMTMTAGGVTSLFVAGDMLAAGRLAAGVDRPPFKPALDKGLAWLSTGDNSITIDTNPGYALYGLERAGLASGFKRFGKHDWFRVLCEKALRSQNEKDGTWNGTDGIRPETCFRILFLARGRHPIMMNKLRFDGPWANRPRDVARLSDFVYDSIERPVNWQVVNLDDGWQEWIDAPILYLASHDPVTVTDAHVKQLRAYIENGGLLLTNADADSNTFTAFVEELAKRVYPEYEMRDLPLNHDVYSMIYPVSGDSVPPLRGLSNGSRLLMIHSPTDLSASWQNRSPRVRSTKVRPIPFQLGANLFVYATGKSTLRNRLDTPLVPETAGNALATFPIARVKHAGPWDPEPGAWPRMAKWFRRETNVALNIVPTEAASLRRADTPFAHLTTTKPWKPSEKELESLRAFVREGGMLLLDPCGGSPDLALALQRDVAQAAFPDQAPRDVNAEDQFIGGTGAGMVNVAKPLLRVYAVAQLGSDLPTMQIMPVGKGWIVISKLDLVSGLLGTNTWGILGYDPNYAQPLMKNLILYACNGRMISPEAAPSTAPVVAPPPAP